jgi:hypothetical protein
MRSRSCLLLVVVFVFMFAPQSFGVDTAYVKTTQTYKNIKTAIDKIGIVDSHEHLRTEKDLIKKQPDFFKLVENGYANVDTRVAGNDFPHDDKWKDENLSVEERWQSFLPTYERIKNTGYMQAILIGIKKVHGIELTDLESVKKINESLKKVYQPGLYEKVLHKIGNIDCVLDYDKWDKGFDKNMYPSFFRAVRSFDRLVVFTSRKDIEWMEKSYGIQVHNVDDLEKIYRKFVDDSIASGVVGFKWTGAYLRSLDFTEYSREKADALLKKLLQNSEANFSWAGGVAFSIEGGRPLSSYCMHTMLRIIEEKKMPLSIHTGLLTWGEADIRRSNPQLLIPLFKEYKNINFDIFHSGWPYVTEFEELGKSWHNVYLNQCWTHIISPEGARQQLSEMLECVPINKIFAFGGDSQTLEQAIGHLEIAKENCAIVLSEKVLDGKFSEAEAIEFAKRILRTNSIELFKLELPKK